PRGVGVDDRKPDSVELHALARPARMPADVVGREQIEELEIERVGHTAARLGDDGHREALDECRRSTEVVGMRMGDDQKVDAPNTTPPEEGHHDSATGVRPADPRPRIDDDPAPVRGTNGGAVTLPYIEKM